MNTKITIKRIGNHWYPDIQHDYPEDLILDEKIEKMLTLLDSSKSDCLIIYFYEQCEILDSNTIQFNEADMVKYLTTGEDFNVSFYIGDHEFKISSRLLALLEYLYNFNFQDSLYRIDIW